jgi:hypothetical protein
MNLRDKIIELEKIILELQTKVNDLSEHTEQKPQAPYSIPGSPRDSSLNKAIDIKTGLTPDMSGSVIWNDSEINTPPINEEPILPVKGYNKHSHSRYSGGALIKDALEIVEYESGDWALITNPHSQQYWTFDPKTSQVKNKNGEMVDKIGLLDLFFNPDGGYDPITGNPKGTWGCAAYEIDVKKCNFVLRDDEGNIVYSAPLYIESSPGVQDLNASSIIWDVNGRNGQGCWRFYAVYASS